MRKIAVFVLAIAFISLLIGGYVGVQWTYNRWYVDIGESLLVRYKGPLLFGSRIPAQPGHFAKEGEVGVFEEMKGPGRHFYCPLWYDCELIDDQIVKPGQVAIVRSMLGDDLKGGAFLVDGDLGETKYKGILRKVYGPGRYRVNTYAYQFNIVDLVRQGTSGQAKYSGWVSIPTGYVGVVTNLSSNPGTGEAAGIQTDVLPPGNYMVNGKEKEIDIVEIGFREATVAVTKQTNPDGSLKVDESGEPLVDNASAGIHFPSNDGFPIHMDFTAIWGIMPDAAPEVIRKFGNVKAVEDKVVLPQIESICRNHGSKYSAEKLLIGEDRQKFQQETSDAFELILKGKQITLQYGLVRHIYIPKQVRQPIQLAFIADELKLTREQEILTAKEEANLREAERMVELESQKVVVETERMVAQRLAEGRKKVGEIKATTGKLIATIDRQVAELEAQATVLRGEARAKSHQMSAEAKAEKFGLAVQAFGSGDAYNKWVFATGLPENVDLNLLYAGEGTFWTDLKGFSETALGKQISQQRNNTKAK